LIMGDGGSTHEKPKSLDGHFHWELLQSAEGLRAIRDACVDYVNRYKKFKNILMWEIANEPYGNMTWAKYPQDLGISQDQTYRYLKIVYDALKPLTNAYVGFSDMEEEQQEKYRLFSNDEFRKNYIDGATDVYSIHIYRKSPDELYEFSKLTDKPKWCTELGSYNFTTVDPNTHAGILAHGELWEEKDNFDSVTSIIPKLLRDDFTLILPWSFTGNRGMVIHHQDGSHELRALPLWMSLVIEKNE